MEHGGGLHSEKGSERYGLLFSCSMEYYILFTNVCKVIFGSSSVFLVQLYRVINLSPRQIYQEQMQMHVPL